MGNQLSVCTTACDASPVANGAQRAILVTGGNSGIGLALCKQLAGDHGCFVFMGCNENSKSGLGGASSSKSREAINEVRNYIATCKKMSVDDKGGYSANPDHYKGSMGIEGQIVGINIDVSNDASVKNSVMEVKKCLGEDGRLYGIVMCHGVNGMEKGVSPNDVMNVNFKGCKRINDAYASTMLSGSVDASGNMGMNNKQELNMRPPRPRMVAVSAASATFFTQALSDLKAKQLLCLQDYQSRNSTVAKGKSAEKSYNDLYTLSGKCLDCTKANPDAGNDSSTGYGLIEATTHSALDPKNSDKVIAGITQGDYFYAKSMLTYGFSKALQNALIAAYGRQSEAKANSSSGNLGDSILYSSVNPGVCDTRFSKAIPFGKKPPEMGTAVIMHALFNEQYDQQIGQGWLINEDLNRAPLYRYRPAGTAGGAKYTGELPSDLQKASGNTGIRAAQPVGAGGSGGKFEEDISRDNNVYATIEAREDDVLYFA